MPVSGSVSFEDLKKHNSLLNWSRFDPYYFENLKKLDRATAQKCLDYLQQLQEIRDAKIIAEREKREAAETAKQQSQLSLSELRDIFLELYAGKLTPQKRGYALESILGGLAKLAGLEITEPFKVNGEQIDGAVKYDGEHYLIEAKWQDKAGQTRGLIYVHSISGVLKDKNHEQRPDQFRPASPEHPQQPLRPAGDRKSYSYNRYPIRGKDGGAQGAGG